MKKLLLILFAIFCSVAVFAQQCAFTTASGPASGAATFVPVINTPGAVIYTWAFGDFHTGTSFGPVTHTYSSPGAYSVCMTVQDTMGVVLCSFCDSVVVTNGATCAFSATATSGTLTMNYQLAAALTGTQYAVWDFGDGSTGYGAAPHHTYTAAGSYTACVQIIDSITATTVCNNCQTIALIQTNNCTYTAIQDSMNPQLYYFFGLPAYQTSTITWTLGDGTNVSGQYIQHTYATAGVYQVCMFENNPNGVNICHHCDSVSVNTGSGTNCNFTYNLTGSNPTIATFVSSVSSPGTTVIHWDFGNGQTTTGNVATALYSTPGAYTVTMTATDGMGNILCVTSQMVIVNAPVNTCTAYYVASAAGLNASFIDLSTGVNPSTTFTWTFGDGNSSSTRFPQHLYSLPGVYSVCLTISDSGCTDTYCSSILVDTANGNPGGNCQANFVKLQVAPYSVIVVDLSTGTNLNYLWDFGDGSTSNQQYPSHSYSSIGTYVLCLTVNNGLLGCSDTYCDTLSVDSMGNIMRSMTGFTINVVSPNTLTGVGTVEPYQNFSVYPNPVIDNLVIRREQSGAATYRLTDLRGAEVLRGNCSATTTAVSLLGIPKGVYLLEVSDPAGNRSFQKVVKE